jgi:GMP synthase (glutamine-hydrolysing)
LITLVVDNLSPFTPDILQCLKRKRASYICKKFFEVGNCKIKYDKVILSGRQKNNREINVINSKIIKDCFQTHIPILGICYGAEIIALTLGGSIRRMPSPVHGVIPLNVWKQNRMITERKSVLVFESHKYCIAKLPDDFDSIASSRFCDHEFFSHKKKDIFGTQFHPEKSGQVGLDIFSNFLIA